MYKLRILNSQYINHNVKKVMVEKPEGFVYRPGQSAHISINRPGWEDVIRPFTFTSLNDWPYLEFIIKIYDERKGFTHQLSLVHNGDEILIHDVFGTIEYKGPGIFIAGGTGITPFISFFRALYLSNNLRGIGLLYSNQCAADIILGAELYQMLGAAYVNVFTRQGIIGFKERRIDRDFLIDTIGDFNNRFYVCGPKSFVEDVSSALIDLGTNPQSLII
ncbi:MAG: hypothetical protein J5I59_11770 [Saprospiraceae bacterium]|nr:hypothetical protein [Saprospiraceae bacterium]